MKYVSGGCSLLRKEWNIYNKCSTTTGKGRKGGIICEENILYNTQNMASTEWTSNCRDIANLIYKCNILQYSGNLFIRLFRSCLYCAGDKIEKNEMGWACGAYGWGEGGCTGSWWGNRRERDHWGDIGVDGWIILRWISRRWDVGIWTGLGWPRIETGGGRLWLR